VIGTTFEPVAPAAVVGGGDELPLSRVASQTPSPAATPIAITAPRRTFGRRLDAATAATLTSRADVAVG
jgi:hypothetical protein